MASGHNSQPEVLHEADGVAREAIARIVAELKGSKKYRWVCEATLERFARVSLERGGSEKEAVKRAKRKLHQAFGAFVEGLEDPGAEKFRRELREGGQDGLKRLCREVMMGHASTKERMELIEREGLYSKLFKLTGVPERIVDIGCGLHPLGIPWMGLSGDKKYTAYDIDVRIVDSLNGFFEGAGIDGKAECRDVLIDPVREQFDLAFVLKTVPTLEGQEKGSGLRMIKALDSKWVVVSFPSRSLCGQAKGMRQSYERMFKKTVEDTGWKVEALYFGTESFYVVAT
jgi:16S rRNA (guanine(1405)-N(7))-methyltransferase